MITGVQPGDVMAIRTGGAAGELIRFGAALLDRPNLENHIAVLHHQTDEVWWAIEGRPGGVGWVDANAYLNGPYTLTNRYQIKTVGQRDMVCQVMLAMLGTPYDWEAILADAGQDLHIDLPWKPTWNGTVPGHVVCSSAAALAYARALVSGPPATPEVQPSDWTSFILTHQYE